MSCFEKKLYLCNRNNKRNDLSRLNDTFYYTKIRKFMEFIYLCTNSLDLISMYLSVLNISEYTIFEHLLICNNFYLLHLWKLSSLPSQRWESSSSSVPAGEILSAADRLGALK